MSNASNVSAGKPKVGGAIFCSPVGTTLPTDAVTALGDDFKSLGYASEDGLTNADSREFSDLTAWGGDPVLSQLNKRSDSFKFKMIEALNPDVLSAVYGSENVSGTLAAGIRVAANSNPQIEMAWVFDMILKNNAVKRIVVPRASVTSVADIVYKDSDAIGYETTIAATPDSAGNTHYEYIKGAAA